MIDAIYQKHLLLDHTDQQDRAEVAMEKRTWQSYMIQSKPLRTLIK